MAAPLALVLVVAVTVRAALFRSSLAEFISERVEVVSPLSSWKRGEATGSSRRAGPSCALLASVNGRRGQWPKAPDSEGTDSVWCRLERAGGRGLRTRVVRERGVRLCGELWALRSGSLEGWGSEGVCPTRVLSGGVWSEKGSENEKSLVGGVRTEEGLGI